MQADRNLCSPSGTTIRAVRGVIMAGGRSQRMRATNGPRHKALVEVAGVPLIEHNLRAMFAARIADIVVVISAQEPTLETYLRERGRPLARAANARLDIYFEREPLGNIGAAGAIADGTSDLLVTFVDNLTTLELGDLLATHRATNAALTLATHRWELRNPFGELDIRDGLVRAYHEKPVRRVPISSGTYVVGPAAASLIPPRHSFGAAELFAAVAGAGLRVAAYEHDAAWIDVNEAHDIARAEQLVGSHAGFAAR